MPATFGCSHRGLRYGLSARGLAVDTVGAAGEEFPVFTTFWLQRPQAGDGDVRFYALLESPRVTGAYGFVLRPGAAATLDVRARLTLREPVARLGIAPLTSMFLAGENQPTADDYRPEVHDSDGLQIVTGSGEWLWRPLTNPRRVFVTSFGMPKLRGYGLMQRDRNFTSYHDLEARYDMRPSAWIEPLGDWGPGRVELLQFNTPNETHDNIGAYWVPDRLPPLGQPMEFAWRMTVSDSKPAPPGAWVVQSRRGHGYREVVIPAAQSAIPHRLRRPCPRGRRRRRSRSGGHRQRQRARPARDRTPQRRDRRLACHGRLQTPRRQATRGVARVPARRRAHVVRNLVVRTGCRLMNITPARSERARSAPPLLRGAITPAPWFGFWRGLLFALWPGQRWPGSGAPAAEWHRAATQRRRVLIALVVALAGTALALRVAESADARDALWWSTTALMTLLFAWVGVGCATAAMGVWALWRGDRFAPVLVAPHGAIDPQARTALVMPICNEDIAEVFAGLRATCESLAATGAMKLFDVFVLSDTADPALRAAEQRAWARLRTMLGETEVGESHLFYRWRKRRTKRKSGNVADFCRRWGRRYRYMVVLDADSTMSGDTLVQLVRLMEQYPRAGIIQTLPQIARPATLHARAQQFASRVSGRLFALGMSWWQLGDAHYWGHNAILRVQPFMRHCGLARLPGRGALAGEILSHDFVEAALMARAGYEVWLAPQLDGSWEQSPLNLLDELQRDRRWCQGNLQNARLVAEPGWRAAHRVMFSVGALSYLVAPLWLVFIAMGLAGGGPAIADAPLWLLTLALLLLPRALGVAMIMQRGDAAAFGGVLRLTGGALLELVLSSLQAPLRMLAHCIYVLGALTGLRLEWKSPPRGENALGWADATRRVGALVLLPLAAGFGLARRAVTVGAGADAAAADAGRAVHGAHRASARGRAVARLGLLRTPEESRPPRPLLRAAERGSFIDLAPPAVPAQRAPRQRCRNTAVCGNCPAAAMAAVALLTFGVPRPGIAPELSTQLRVEHELNLRAYWRDLPSLPPVLAQPPVARKRMAARDNKPARMIDNAIRQRAFEAVERAIATESPPT